MREPVMVVEPRGHAVAGLARLQGERLRTRGQVARAMRGLRRAIWLAPTEAALEMLAQAIAGRLAGDQRLLALAPADVGRRALLHSAFRQVVAGPQAGTLLPLAELVEVLGFAGRSDLFIGGTFDADDRIVVLYRGDLQPLVVPLTTFSARPGGPRPDPTALRIGDGGQTVCLGEYEAAADAILYEHDGDFRRRARAREVQKDPSIGGAIRRLRLQKGLAREDFARISGKEIARIERGEVKRPHRHTLAAIARRLGVRLEELPTF
jgi:hypothetical protein